MSGTIVQEVNVIKLVAEIGRKNKRAQAKILGRLETVIGKETEEYQEMRKLILDELNNLTRAYVNEIFGDIEFLIR